MAWEKALLAMVTCHVSGFPCLGKPISSDSLSLNS